MVTKMREEAKTPITFKTTISGFGDLENGFNKLSDIYNDIVDGKEFDYLSLIDEDFVNEFSVAGEEYNKFIEIIANSPTEINACKDAFNNLAEAYIYNSDALKNITPETYDLSVAYLKQLGVTNDRNQSLRIQEQLTKSIQEINDKLDKMKYDTDMRFLENQKQLQETREKTDKRTRAEMKDKISRAYRYYHAKKSWNYMEKEALLDLIEEYEAAGGKNSFVHSVVVPEMCLWEEITEFEGDVHEK